MLYVDFRINPNRVCWFHALIHRILCSLKHYGQLMLFIRANKNNDLLYYLCYLEGYVFLVVVKRVNYKNLKRYFFNHFIEINMRGLFYVYVLKEIMYKNDAEKFTFL